MRHNKGPITVTVLWSDGSRSTEKQSLKTFLKEIQLYAKDSEINAMIYPPIDKGAKKQGIDFPVQICFTKHGKP